MYKITTAVAGCTVALMLAAPRPASATAALPAQYGHHAGQVQEIGYRRRWARRWGGPAYSYGYGYRPYGYYRPYAYYGRPYGYYGGPYAYGGPYGYYGGRYAYGGPYGYYGRGFYGRPGISLGFAF
jgi:hypothetical protein